MRVTILGCGSSGGVPRVGNVWGDCDPAEPRNRRRRCSLLVETAGLTLLIDTSPDLRDQANDAGVSRIDAVFYTHAHADQAHGIDDLRGFVLMHRRRIDVYADRLTLETLRRRFDYCFTQRYDYPPILTAHELDGPVTLTGVDDAGGEGEAVTVIPVPVEHGEIPALGFRIGGMAYIPDVSGIAEESFALLDGLDLWIVDALRYRPHPSHAHVERTLEWISRVRPRRAILSNLHHDLDYRRLASELPKGVEPAFDGLTVTL